MNDGIRNMLFYKLHHTEVGDDESVGNYRGKLAQNFFKPRNFVVCRKGIERQIKPFSAFMDKFQRVVKLFKGEVVCRRSHAEFLQCTVYGIGAVVYRKAQLFGIAGGGKYFRCSVLHIPRYPF